MSNDVPSGTQAVRDSHARIAQSDWLGPRLLPNALGVAAVFEFLSNRVLQPLSGPMFGAVPGSTLAAIIGTTSRFSQNLAAVLGILVVGALLLSAMRPQGAASQPLGRVSIVMMGGLSLVLSALLTLAPDFMSAAGLLKRAQWLLQLSSVCVALLITLGVLQRRGPRGIHKLGIVLLMLPALFQLEIQWGVMTASGYLQRYGLLTLLYGPLVAMATLAMGSLCVSEWRPARPRPAFVALGFAVSAALVMAVVIFMWSATALRLIYMSFDLRLPMRFEAQTLYLLCLTAWVYSVAGLMFIGREANDSERSRGLGLLLLGLAGCQARTLPQMMFFLAGLLCAAEGVLSYAGRRLALRRSSDEANQATATASAP
ncbi:MAG: hypothetical protein JNJ46_04900 [Myxococcales bacterium]|nr:hypothetical protein [Myxococcales bacterium]